MSGNGGITKEQILDEIEEISEEEDEALKLIRQAVEQELDGSDGLEVSVRHYEGTHFYVTVAKEYDVEGIEESDIFDVANPSGRLVEEFHVDVDL